MVAHTFIPSTLEADVGRSLEFEGSLVYRVSSAQPGLQRNTVLKNKSIKFIG